MKTIIVIILIYIILVILSASLMRYIFAPFKGTELEETWRKSITDFSKIYFIIGIVLMMLAYMKIVNIFLFK